MGREVEESRLALRCGEENFNVSRGILSRRDESSQDSTLISRVSSLDIEIKMKLNGWEAMMAEIMVLCTARLVLGSRVLLILESMDDWEGLVP